MGIRFNNKYSEMGVSAQGALFCLFLVALLCPFNIFSQNRRKPVRPTVTAEPTLPDSIPLGSALDSPAEVQIDRFSLAGDSLLLVPVDSIPVAAQTDIRVFNPDPTRAVWLSALCPGLGQLYNRSFWKLPIVIGAYVGLGYATSWNNSMLRDYTRAYADLLDNDPNTRSYMDFFPSTTDESSLNKTWLINTFKSRKNFYRRNRDLCIICMVGVYLLAIVDSYVDATLMHFDISPDLSLQWSPALIPDTRTKWPGMGIQWAMNF